MLPTITTPAEGLDIIDIIRPAPRERDNVVFGKGAFSATIGTSLLGKNLQGIPLNLCVTTACPIFHGIPSRFQVSNILLMPRTIITVIYLFGVRWFPHSSICRLLVKRHSFFTKQRITPQATKMPFLPNIARWFSGELLPTVIAYSKKMGTICFPDFTASIQTYFVPLLETFNSFWHIFIITHFNIHENPELLGS